MEDQERVHLCIDKKNLEILDKIKKENHLSSRSKAINYMIEQFAKMVVDKPLDNKGLKKEVQKLKSASNSNSKDLKIVLELLNGIYYKETYGTIPTLDSGPTRAYTMSKDYIETKLAKEHYKKSNTLD
jgi:hypothetical protein